MESKEINIQHKGAISLQLLATANVVNHNKRVWLSSHQNSLTELHMLHIHTLCTLTFIWVKLISVMYLEKIALLSMREAICKPVTALKILVLSRDCKTSISLQRQ